MRNDFVREMLSLMAHDSKIVLLTGDLGFRAFEPIRDQFLDRFVNVGAAEANLIGVACGMALTGWKPFAYSIATFASLRCLEQIRTDICYHNLDVKVIGAGGGYNYAHQGVTHHTVEDLACLRALPNMRVLCPAYSWEASQATRALAASPGPAYLRLGKSPGIPYDEGRFQFEIGKAYTIRDGKDAALLCTGNVLDLALACADRLKESGIQLRVVSVPTIKPLDTGLLSKLAAQVPVIYTLEEHGMIGGLGSAVAEWLATQNGPRPRLKMFGFPDRFITEVGNRDFLLAQAGLSAEKISETIAVHLKQIV